LITTRRDVKTRVAGKNIDSPATNSDYRIMDMNLNTQICAAKKIRLFVMPVWRARRWPVVDSIN